MSNIGFTKLCAQNQIEVLTGTIYMHEISDDGFTYSPMDRTFAGGKDHLQGFFLA